ncbi:hypothetical protein [Frankia sp. R82]|uniref:hypothetical protein n=1 Tax=Frankia sp. R82 TaxID=2950553 RepID=UPI0020433AFE|nr:hypothetical protein [Frankia sp. R82]MCM3883146.1 hypothetical protein [Frankia sp. R82]
MPTPLTLTDATDFILSHASEQDLPQIMEAVKQRHRALAALRTASLTTGTPVRLDRLKPGYLNGLTGILGPIDGKFATVILDADSTKRLRVTSRNKSYVVPSDEARFDLEGVPLVSCLPI